MYILRRTDDVQAVAEVLLEVSVFNGGKQDVLDGDIGRTSRGAGTNLHICYQMKRYET